MCLYFMTNSTYVYTYNPDNHEVQYYEVALCIHIQYNTLEPYTRLSFDSASIPR